MNIHNCLGLFVVVYKLVNFLYMWCDNSGVLYMYVVLHAHRNFYNKGIG